MLAGWLAVIAWCWLVGELVGKTVGIAADVGRGLLKFALASEQRTPVCEHMRSCLCSVLKRPHHPPLHPPQAQFVAALRAALKPGTAPALAVCGGMLATSFLSAGLAAGDGAVMRRLMDLLVAPLQVCRLGVGLMGLVCWCAEGEVGGKGQGCIDCASEYTRLE